MVSSALRSGQSSPRSGMGSSGADGSRSGVGVWLSAECQAGREIAAAHSSCAASRVDPHPLITILAEKKLLIHNALFDLSFLSQMGFEIGEGKVVDTGVEPLIRSRLPSTVT